MRVKGAVDIHMIEFLDIPNEKHPVRVKSDHSVVDLVNNAANYISKFRFVRSRYLDFTYADKDIRISQWWRSRHSNYVL
jgi:hypothetical protein